MLIKTPTEHAKQLQKLDDELQVEITRALEDESVEPDHVLERLVAISDQHLDETTTLELAAHVRRHVLGAQWHYLSHRGSASHLVRRVMEELDVIGYEHPANWADIRLELAAQYERESNHKDALAIRDEVRGETRRIVSELQLLKHV